jgi:hypothetical protein
LFFGALLIIFIATTSPVILERAFLTIEIVVVGAILDKVVEIQGFSDQLVAESKRVKVSRVPGV